MRKRILQEDVNDAIDAAKALSKFCEKALHLDEDGDMLCDCPFLKYNSGGWNYCAITDGYEGENVPQNWEKMGVLRGENGKCIVEI